MKVKEKEKAAKARGRRGQESNKDKRKVKWGRESNKDKRRGK